LILNISKIYLKYAINSFKEARKNKKTKNFLWLKTKKKLLSVSKSHLK